jgi:hypothetical protein
MGGGLMQLVAYGAQDVYLTGDPQITFFKVIYRRHTNFAIESIEQTINGNPDFGKRVSCTISRNGDLINNVYLQLHLPALSTSLLAGTVASGAKSLCWCNAIGHAIIASVELEIGGQRIDRHYGTWMEIWNELTITSEKRNGYAQMVGKYACDNGMHGNAAFDRIFYIPLQFWFCRNPGLSLPLIALQYHEVKINLEFRNFYECVVALGSDGKRLPSSLNVTNFPNAVSITTATFYVDYIYLDSNERKLFAQSSHEYLIDQLQFTGAESIQLAVQNQKLRLNFNHPVKELIWVIQRDENANTAGTSYNDWFNFSAAGPGTPDLTTSVDLMADAKILLNGYERFTIRPQTYFRLVQPWQHHTRIPDKHIYLYSFAIRPEEHQPSGTCNFSRIDTVQLVYDLTNLAVLSAMNVGLSPTSTGQISVFAVNYNILRVTSGMAGVAYAN